MVGSETSREPREREWQKWGTEECGTQEGEEAELARGKARGSPSKAVAGEARGAVTEWGRERGESWGQPPRGEEAREGRSTEGSGAGERWSGARRWGWRIAGGGRDVWDLAKQGERRQHRGGGGGGGDTSWQGAKRGREQ